MLMSNFLPAQTSKCAFQRPKKIQTYVCIGMFDPHIGGNRSNLLQLRECCQPCTS